MQLDLPTLAIVGFLCSLGACIGFTSLMLVLRGLPVLRWWVTSLWIGTIGIILLGLRNQIPDWLSISVANVTVTLASALLLKGVALHVGRPLRWRWPLMLVALYSALNIWFTYVTPDLRTRVVLFSAVSVAWDAWTVTYLLRYAPRDVRLSCRIAAAIMVADALHFAYRATLPLNPDAGQNAFAAGSPIIITYVAGIVVGLAGYFSLLLMVTERLMVDLRRTARMDSLTGLLNRGAVINDGVLSLGRARQAGQPFSLLVIDLDYFKQVNDTWGHDAGDAALCHVARMIRRHLPEGDAVAGRYGGEEFVVGLPGWSMHEASSMAEQLRAELADVPFAYRGKSIAMTTSIGVATALDGQTFQAIVARADEALYQAKSQGRNEVIQARQA
ncbi:MULTISPECIES: GGDEF domain-containing protein [Dyella]|uniref:diguanylate cyclase n=2 Tax=Dyella TaxID=231454 RepID=A0A4R0YZT7_9GAMM|nr:MULTISPECIES: GGDEF domain-containing protein [Dyella]TBR39543.1 GGDEF domain-containing protein [Dyella terrae]TCI12874.1 GGDEF domain-containing protein [Dyella soli]